MKNPLRLTAPYAVVLLLALGVASPTAGWAQGADAPATGSPGPAPLRVNIWPLAHSSLLRVCYESDAYASVRCQICNERGRVLYSEVLRTSRYVGTLDLANLPTGPYTLELQTPTEHHEAAFRVVQPVPAVVVSMVMGQEPSVAAR